MKAAVDFVKYVLDPKGGLAVFDEMGQDIVGPKAMGSGENIPAELKPLMKK